MIGGSMNKLGDTWLGFGKELVSAYDFAVFVVNDDSVTAEDLLKNDKLVECIGNDL